MFGHSHVPQFYAYGNGRYYINDGTWIDENVRYVEDDDSYLSRTIAVITTGAVDTADVYQYTTSGSLRKVTEMLLADHPSKVH